MATQNRQSDKTRDAIRTAFAKLVFSARYDEIRMVDVAHKANVGRSTLYLHYPNKDSIFLDNMGPMLSELAQATKGVHAQPNVEAVLEHFWSNRDRGRVVLFGTTGQKLETAYAQRLAETLQICTTTIALPFVVNSISAATFAILRTWLRGEASGTASDVARHICMATQAALDATCAADDA